MKPQNQENNFFSDLGALRIDSSFLFFWGGGRVRGTKPGIAHGLHPVLHSGITGPYRD